MAELPQLRLKFASGFLDSHTQSKGVDADNPLEVLVGEINQGKLEGGQDQALQLKRYVIHWTRDNQVFNRAYKGKDLSAELTQQKLLVEEAESIWVKKNNLPTERIDQQSFQGAVDNLAERIIPVSLQEAKGSYVKQEVGADFLKTNPPVNLLRGSDLPLDKAIDKYSVSTILAMSRRTEAGGWMSHYLDWLKNLTYEDLELRAISTVVVDRRDFSEKAANFFDKWTATGSKADGVVVIMSPSESLTERQGFWLMVSSRLLHYWFEVDSFGRKYANSFKDSQVSKKTHLNQLKAMGMSKSERKDRFFDVHAMLESIAWQQSLKRMRQLFDNESKLFGDDYKGEDKVVLFKADDQQVLVGLHPFNVVTRVFKDSLSTGTTTTRLIKLKLFMGFYNLSLEEAETKLFGNLEQGIV